MKTSTLVLVALACLVSPLTLCAQVEGVHLEGGIAFLTATGGFTFSPENHPSEYETDVGYAFRARLRLGYRFLSVAVELQQSLQNYSPFASGLLTTSCCEGANNTNSTSVAATAALHPFTFGRFVPYAEVGVGVLTFSDITTQGSIAPVYGFGTGFGPPPRWTST